MPVPSVLTQPAIAGRAVVEVREPLQVRPNYDWYYVHYPHESSNWFVGQILPAEGVPDEEVGVWWLPKLQTETTQPGINLHRTIGKNERKEAAYDNAQLQISRDGGIVLGKSLGYCVAVECIDPRTQREGLYYMDAWSTPRPYRKGKRLKAEFDRQRHHRWLLHLMLDGVIPSPEPYVISEIVERQKARIARREAQTDLPTEKREELAEEAEIAAAHVESATVPVLESQGAQTIVPSKARPTAPAPKKGRK
jgi:hypothetical protein